MTLSFQFNLERGCTAPSQRRNDMKLQVVVTPTKHVIPHNSDKITRYWDSRRQCWVNSTYFSAQR